MSVTSGQIMRVCQCRDSELWRLRQIMQVPGTGSGIPMSYDERLADVLVTIWHAQAVALEYGPNSIPWAMLSVLGDQLLRSDEAVISRGVLTIQLRLIRTDWDTIPSSSSSRLERMEE